MTPEELIHKGIEIIQRDGWNQGDMFQRPLYSGHDEPPSKEQMTADGNAAAETAPVCAMGSVYRAAYGSCHISHDGYKDIALGNTLAEALAKMTKAANGCLADGFGIAAFNDRTGTTAEDVLLMMKKAAEL